MGREGEAWEEEGEAWEEEGEVWEGECEAWEGEGEACKGKLRLGKGRVRHRTSAEAWERNDRGQGGEPPPRFPPTPPCRLA